MKGFSIVGIGTDVGKTLVSMAAVEVLEGAYFKPVQAGDLDKSDTNKVQKWCSTGIEIIDEVYRLSKPMAPHAAAEIDGVQIQLEKIIKPKISRPLIIEGAGGIFVPLNEKETMLDLYKKMDLPIILVSRHYLGSINHTFLTIEAIRQAGLKIAGIVYVGESSEHSENIIDTFYKLKVLGRIALPKELSRAYVQQSANELSGLRYEI